MGHPHEREPRWTSGQLFIDVKATRGAFDSPIHMSMAEIRWAATHANHRIARIHGLSSEAPVLTMFSGIHELAGSIVNKVVPTLPTGIAIDGFEIDVAQLQEEFRTKVELGGD